MLVLERRTEDGVLPVGTLTQDRGIGIIVVGAYHAHGGQFVVILGELAQVQQADALGLALDGEHAVVGEFGAAGFTALGGDEHNAVSTLGTVNGGGRGILQDFHAHDVRGVDGGQRGNRGNGTVTQGIAQTEVCAGRTAALNDDTIYHVQRLRIGVDGGLTTHADGGAGTRSTGSLYCGNTGCTALEGLVDVGDDGALDGVFLHGDGCAGKVALFHGTVTHDDNLVQEFGILFQDNVDDFLGANGDFLRCIADGREYECSAGLHCNRVVSIDVCDDTIVGALLHDRHADCRSLGIRDVTRHLVLCEQGRSGKECQHEGHKFLFHATRFWVNN